MSNILLDLLSSAMFSGVPSNTVYDVLKGGYRKFKQQKPLEEMYLDAFVSAIDESKPQLRNRQRTNYTNKSECARLGV